jgi:hypothetical protein
LGEERGKINFYKLKYEGINSTNDNNIRPTFF